MRKNIVAVISLGALCGALLYSSHVQALSSVEAMKQRPSFSAGHEVSQAALEGRSEKVAAVPAVLLVAAAGGAAFGVGYTVGYRVAGWLFGTSTPPPTDPPTDTATNTESATATSTSLNSQLIHRANGYAWLDSMFNPSSARE